MTISAAALTGCGGEPDNARPSPSPAPPVTSEAPIGTASAAGELAGLAAAAKGKSYTATYELTRGEGAPEDVEVELIAGDRWSVKVPGGAHGGKSDVTMARKGDIYLQCVESKDDRCVFIETPDGEIPDKIDPVIQHVFTDWLDVMLNRDSPLSVAHSKSIKGADGECFWLERNSVSVAAPLAVGVYCLRTDGIVTAVKADFGLLRLKNEPTAAPQEMKLPDTEADATPLGTSPPPKPSPSKSKKRD